jgi:hypothetical protein
MKYHQYFNDRIKISIFKYVDHPLNLGLTCKSWASIVKNPSAKAEWLIINCGKVNALSYALKLGPTFINMAVFQNLIARKVTFSRCFIFRILKYIRKFNDVGQQEICKTSWANNLSLLVDLLKEGYNQLTEANESLPSIDIKDLILSERFIPLSLKPRSFQLDVNSNSLIQRTSQYRRNNSNSLIRRTSQYRRKRVKFIRKYRKFIQYNLFVNDQERLNQIMSIPPQTAVDDPKTYEFYNGFSFV